MSLQNYTIYNISVHGNSNAIPIKPRNCREHLPQLPR